MTMVFDWNAAGRRRFRDDSRGGVALLFAGVAMVLCGTAALAIDVGRAYSSHGALQRALDSAVLAGAMAKAQGRSDYAAVISTYMSKNFTPRNGEQGVTITPSVGASGEVSASATATLPSFFAQVIGIPTLEISAATKAAFGAGKAEVAIALDTTGSMDGAKLAGAKDAAKGLIDQLYSTPSADTNVKISLVPFTSYVNVGTTYRSAAWMDVPADSSSTANQCWDTYPNAVYTNPRTVTGTCTNDGAPYSCTYTEYDVSWGQAVQQCGPITTATTWYGCAGSRNLPKDTVDAVSAAAKVPGIMNVGCPSPLVRLTSDKSSVKSQIESMTAGGDTYIQSGLLWAWRTLSTNAPFSDGAPNDGMTRKFLILLTDGANTRSPNYPDHEGSDTTLANSLTAETCTGIKAQGIQIFTVAFDVTDTTARDMLAACSSGPPYFYTPTTVSEMQTAFRAIGAALVGVHLVQ